MVSLQRDKKSGSGFFLEPMRISEGKYEINSFE
jgi:hypothetical protein